jgi:hypothetical protein
MECLGTLFRKEKSSGDIMGQICATQRYRLLAPRTRDKRLLGPAAVLGKGSLRVTKSLFTRKPQKLGTFGRFELYE